MYIYYFCIEKWTSAGFFFGGGASDPPPPLATGLVPKAFWLDNGVLKKHRMKLMALWRV